MSFAATDPISSAFTSWLSSLSIAELSGEIQHLTGEQVLCRILPWLISTSHLSVDSHVVHRRTQSQEIFALSRAHLQTKNAKTRIYASNNFCGRKLLIAYQFNQVLSHLNDPESKYRIKRGRSKLVDPFIFVASRARLHSPTRVGFVTGPRWNASGTQQGERPRPFQRGHKTLFP